MGSDLVREILICCDDSYSNDSITMGESYEILRTDGERYWIWDDNRTLNAFMNFRFCKPSVWRSNKLKDILG